MRVLDPNKMVASQSEDLSMPEAAPMTSLKEAADDSVAAVRAFFSGALDCN